MEMDRSGVSRVLRSSNRYMDIFPKSIRQID
jgi:hypothetical protein